MQLKKLPGEIILECVVGSQLYNLDTVSSDVDIKGVYVTNPEDFWKLGNVKEVVDHTSPDWAYFELKKFCNLAMKMNPTIIELLFAPEYTRLSKIGEELVQIRNSFLNKKAVNSYLGYALQQVKRKYRNASDITEYRAGKHVRHTWRLCKQYEQLATTGTLNPRLTDEERKECFKFQEKSYRECLQWFIQEDERLRKLPSILPDEPDIEAINSFLCKTYRRVLNDHK